MNIRNSTVTKDVILLPDTGWHGKMFVIAINPHPKISSTTKIILDRVLIHLFVVKIHNAYLQLG